MPIDLQKFKDDFERELKKAAALALKQIDRKDKMEIGDAAIDEMKKVIAKGISPIKGVGRFEAYKWAGAANRITKIAKGLTGARKKSARQKASDLKKGKYPFSMKNKFPNKRERPVNLFLSGDQLSNLITKPTQSGLEVGYYDKLSAQKEQGHREGVNGQPRRPTIPKNGEEFSPSIYRRIVDVVTSIVGKKFRT